MNTINTMCDCKLKDYGECYYFDNDLLYIRDAFMEKCSLTKFLSFISELNHIKQSRGCNIIFDMSYMQYNSNEITITDHKPLRGKKVTAKLLLDWNDFVCYSGRDEDVIDIKYIRGKDNIFTTKYISFNDFCIAFDDLCCKVAKINLETLEEERESWDIEIMDLESCYQYKLLSVLDRRVITL